jgi:citrate lyase subunit beta/citryl-CoA lyase
MSLRTADEHDTAPLPERYWRQQAHLVAPAGGDRAEKALTRGTSSAARLLAEVDISEDALAERLGVVPDLVARALAEPSPSPVVVLDGEDGVAPTAEARLAAAEAAGAVMRQTPAAEGQLRFFRPVGARDPHAEQAVAGFLQALGDGACDGLVLPKVESPEEVVWAADLLDRHEAASPPQRSPMRLGVMVESAKGQLSLGDTLSVRKDRLCCVIVGFVDYAADLGLMGELDDHPQVDALRQWVTAHTTLAGIPAIDGMTLAFPVADHSWPREKRRGFILDRIALVFQQARAAMHGGMRGKWVGHPLQLLAVLLAFADAYSPERIEEALAEAGLYTEAASGGRGVDLIGTAMSDAATDARVRRYLQDARLMGYLEAAGPGAAP